MKNVVNRINDSDTARYVHAYTFTVKYAVCSVVIASVDAPVDSAIGYLRSCFDKLEP